MSTRCQIRFIVGSEYVTIYRHSDGYPTGVIPDLKEFLEWNKGRNDDIEYMAANFIYWSKVRLVKEIGNNIYQKLGFGICGDHLLHSDIQYFYTVESKQDGKISITTFDFDKHKGDPTYENKQLLNSEDVMI